MAEDLHAAFVYAFQKLGFLVTEANKDSFTDEELEEWEDAIDEWLAENPQEERPPNGANGAA